MRDSTLWRILAGYDGSLPAGTAIEAGARLMPTAQARIAYLWTPPFASDAMRRRLWRKIGGVDDFVAAVEREGEAEARRVAAVGVLLAEGYGWKAEPLIRHTYSGEGLQLARLAGRIGTDLAVVGSRGLGGARAILGSVSDMFVHYAPCPVLVVPYPLLQNDWAALADGPVVVGWDGSAGARTALETAGTLLPTRPLVPVFVRDGDEPAGVPPAGLVTRPERPAVLEHGRSVAAALVAEARDRRAAVIAVGSLGRSALREIVVGSVAMATLHHAFRPVLFVPQSHDPVPDEGGEP
ncbi:universal stress protein [Actinoplanes sp. NBRC 101535]|uniref:universal stress protein n=1 Tax=Actinoplanes sp. NBRC 101535 TaxID=3032196 RepID=UPI0024A331E2|nr:universal stress protein [Actinoplanes sp. NBRC 101535]GLY06451.1 universal stress protein [Actinoplanes sp. NBRC 101535]